MTEKDVAEAAAQALKGIGSKAIVLYAKRRADEAATWDIAFDGDTDVDIPDAITIECLPSESQVSLIRKVRAELNNQKSR